MFSSHIYFIDLVSPISTIVLNILRPKVHHHHQHYYYIFESYSNEITSERDIENEGGLSALAALAKVYSFYLIN